MTSSLVVSSDSLSSAWASVFLASLKSSRLIPTMVTVDALGHDTPLEDAAFRDMLDAKLDELGLQSCRTVANTIFPVALWDPTRPADELYGAYFGMLPRLRRHAKNRRGLYFERLVDFGSGGAAGTGRNQLQHIIDTWRRGNHRRSALQAAVFDPMRDHVHSPRLGFPCLHQVAFLADGEEMVVVGYYGLQWILERAYGNYLGLIRIGEFMAHEMGLRLTRMVCVAGSSSLGVARKRDLIDLRDRAESLLNDHPASVTIQ